MRRAADGMTFLPTRAPGRAPDRAASRARVAFGVALLAALVAGCGATPTRPATAGGAAVPPARADADGGAGARVADLALRYVGTPYRYGGASPDGFDCSGLVWYVHRELGVAVPRTAATQRAAAAPVARDALRPGDLVFFHTPRDHVGIYLGDGDFVHAPASGRRVERARLDSPFFLLAYAGGGRFATGGALSDARLQGPPTAADGGSDRRDRR